ncbi:MAG: tetratricopeptide repeat protein [Candidatus Thioglobus sp.]|uniref:tetratricopeptide repeat protein n=1 Tax=Candidatus Thioglobus sp. TaxID=2026721 RepID=UPI00262AB2AC|nr:tetratricopeptide repeat protein [Candidatus Thioglobus sp.]MDC9726310.1 tetratricopeptide repeat protein [Candidatus Thioglobus sp.]
MKLIFLLLLPINAQAGLLDFLNIYQANTAYEQKDFKLAGEKFAAVDNDFARLNQANSLYKQGLYQQSLDKYQLIKHKSLDFDRLYNSGNAFAKSGKINEAIESYEAALKIRKDKDAEFNLALLKKQKRKKSKKSKDKKNNKKEKSPQKKPKKGKSNNKQQQKQKLSTIKQQRWEKALNKKLRTLMIPLNQPTDNHEQNPW